MPERRDRTRFEIRQAVAGDEAIVRSILIEAAAWLGERGIPLWYPEELDTDVITPEVAEGRFFLAEVDGEPAGTLRFDLADPEFWPDVEPAGSAFVHRFAVRRRFAGGAMSTRLLSWAVARTRMLGRSHLRLDCEAARPRLREFYERFGFRHHSDRQVGPFFVSRYELRVHDHPDPEPVRWYGRAEVAGMWRIPACPRHAPVLEQHRFTPIASPAGREGAGCAACERAELLREVERCTCEYDSARCPAHQNLGCGG